MDIILDKIGKRYIHEWVFRDISVEINKGSSWALTGPNGSGKSTLLQIISGYRLPSLGQIRYSSGGKNTPADIIFSRISFASPYLELIEEFTLKEQLQFHFTWRETNYSFSEVADFFQIAHAMEKPVKYFSSGMKQRLKLALAFCTKSEILLLDEPTSNLDHKGIEAYERCLENLLDSRTVIIASNEPREYKSCENQLVMSHYK
jgi:ABC-type multidrug transport system ATPase subunit